MAFDLPAGQAVLRAMMVNAVKGNRTPAVALHGDRAGAERRQKVALEALYNVPERPTLGQPKPPVSREG